MVITFVCIILCDFFLIFALLTSELIARVLMLSLSAVWDVCWWQLLLCTEGWNGPTGFGIRGTSFQCSLGPLSGGNCLWSVKCQTLKYFIHTGMSLLLWRAEIWAIEDHSCLLAGRDIYCATPAVTWSLNFCGPRDNPIWSPCVISRGNLIQIYMGKVNPHSFVFYNMYIPEDEYKWCCGAHFTTYFLFVSTEWPGYLWLFPSLGESPSGCHRNDQMASDGTHDSQSVRWYGHTHFLSDPGWSHTLWV